MEKVVITRKPWFKLAIGLFDMALANAFIVYKSRKAKDQDRKASHPAFLKRLVDKLMESKIDRLTAQGCTLVSLPTRPKTV